MYFRFCPSVPTACSIRKLGESGGRMNGTQVRPSSSWTAAMVRVGRS